jgi:hypothetical protein
MATYFTERMTWTNAASVAAWFVSKTLGGHPIICATTSAVAAGFYFVRGVEIASVHEDGKISYSITHKNGSFWEFGKQATKTYVFQMCVNYLANFYADVCSIDKLQVKSGGLEYKSFKNLYFHDVTFGPIFERIGTSILSLYLVICSLE